MLLQITYNLMMNNISNLPPVCESALDEYLRPDLFKSLCDPTRLSLVAYLATSKKPITVGSLAQLYGIDFSGVSRHLKLLKDTGVVIAEKQGREVVYSLNGQQLTQSLRGFANALEMCLENSE